MNRWAPILVTLLVVILIVTLVGAWLVFKDRLLRLLGRSRRHRPPERRLHHIFQNLADDAGSWHGIAFSMFGG